MVFDSPLDLFRVLFLFIFSAAGWTIVREDLAVGKIRNKRLALVFGACLAGYALQSALSLAGGFGLGEPYLSQRFYAGALLHAGISLAFALGLWIGGVWPAGDAKFFIVCALFTPLIDPGQKAFPYYLSLNLLVNIFALAALYVLAAAGACAAAALARADPGDAPARIKALLAGRSWRWRESLPRALNTGGLFLAQTLSGPLLEAHFGGWASSPIVLYLALFVLWDRVKLLVSHGKLAFVSGTAVAAFIGSGLIRPPVGPLLEPFLIRWLGFGVFLGAARRLAEFYFTERASQTVGSDEIAPGMILSDKSLTLLRRDADYFKEHFTPIFRDGLSSPQAEALRQWLIGLPRERRSIEVVRAAPFGVWILAGTLFTLAARRDAASLALALFR